jgi:hypothetical protein
MWEYEFAVVVLDDLDRCTTELNELGSAGWELVSVLPRLALGFTPPKSTQKKHIPAPDCLAVFKRRKPDGQASTGHTAL